MKKYIKIIAAILIIAMAAASVACAKAGTEITTPIPMEQEAQPNGGDVSGEIVDPNKIDYKFWRIAYDYENGNSKPAPIVITNVKDFDQFVVSRLPEAQKKAALETYNDEFFGKNHLIMFTVTFSSGSVVPEVTAVEDVDGTVTVTVNGRMDGDVGTADMATHLGIVVLDNMRWSADAPVAVIPKAAADSVHREEE